MKNKWIVGVLMVALLSVAATAQNSYMPKPGNGSLFGGREQASGPRMDSFGLGVHLGIGQNNPKALKDAYDEAFDNGWTGKELKRNAGFLGLEVMYERALGDEANKLGLKAGWDMYGKNKLELKYPGDNLKATESTHAFPITVYYKRDNGVKNFSWLAGAGITIMRSEIEIEETGFSNESYSKTKVFPHITLGAEYRFTELFALGLDVRYNIAAKIKKDGDVLSNRSGFGGALAARFYF